MAAVENFILKITVQGQQAVDGLKKSITGLGSTVSGFGGYAGKMTSAISGIIGGLGGMATIAGTAATAFVGLGLKAIALADDLSDISDATGISAGALNNFRNSLVDAGGKTDDFSTLALKLNQNLGDAATGGEKAQKAFQKLGVFVRDANGNVRDTGDVLREAIAKLAAIENQSIASAAAVDIFGKNASKYDFKQLNAANDFAKDAQIAQLIKYQKAIDSIAKSASDNLLTVFGKLAIAIDDAQKKADAVEKKANERGNIGPRVTTAGTSIVVMPERPMTKAEKDKYELNKKLAEAYKDQAREMDRLGKIGKEATGTGDFGATSEATLKAIADSQKRLAQSRVNTNRNIALAGANEIQSIEINAAAEIARAREEIFNQERLTDAQKSAEFAAKKKEIETKAVIDTAKLRSQISAKIFSEEEAQRQKFNEELAAEEKRIQDIVTASSQVVDEIILQNAELAKQAFFAQTISTLTDTERANAQALFDIEQERLKLLKQIADIKDLPYAERLAREKAVNNLLNQRKTDAVENQQEQKRLSMDFSAGWGKAYRQYVEDAGNTSRAGYELFATATRGMEDAIVNFSKTGKFEFKSFLSTVVEELLRSQIRQLLASTFGGGSTNILGSLFGSIFGTNTGPAGAAVLGLPGYAAGGMIPNNSPVIVGENGPEILTGAGGRSVIPNNALGGSTMITYNINAVDASSFRSLVASDPEFIFAVTEQGRRRQPTARR